MPITGDVTFGNVWPLALILVAVCFTALCVVLLQNKVDQGFNVCNHNGKAIQHQMASVHCSETDQRQHWMTHHLRFLQTPSQAPPQAADRPTPVAVNLEPAYNMVHTRATSAWISQAQRFSSPSSDLKSTAKPAQNKADHETHGKENRSRQRPATAGPVAALDFTKPQPGSVVFGRVPLREQLLSDLAGRRKRRLQEEVRRDQGLGL